MLAKYVDISFCVQPRVFVHKIMGSCENWVIVCKELNVLLPQQSLSKWALCENLIWIGRWYTSTKPKREEGWSSG